ncbi:MAG: Flavin mononucleotide phosphatase YigB [Candidatus Heimdallarchaeota archaeon LC_3]|nr:MAG: Flavin mononucleotide phosphatase YigB [Candidatus Heimdallarchaeota archaeon LC_3]
MVPPEIISFDLFDTLVVVRGFEPKQAFEKSYQTLCSIKNISDRELSYEQFFQMYRTKIRYYLNQRQKTGKDFTNDELIINMLEEFRIKLDTSQATQIANAYFDALLPYTIPFPGLRETLEFLAQDYQLILTSNHSWPAHGISTLNKVGINNLFIKKTFSGKVGWAKPYSQIWEEAIDGLNVNKNQILHVGDNPRTDIDGAINFGFLACWYKSRNHFKYSKEKKVPIEPKTTHSPNFLGIIKELNELPGLLKKLFPD